MAAEKKTMTAEERKEIAQEKKNKIRKLYDSFAELNELCYIEEIGKSLEKITKSITMIILSNIDSMQKNKYETNPFDHNKFILLQDKLDKKEKDDDEERKSKKAVFKFNIPSKEMIGFIINRMVFESLTLESVNNFESYTLKVLIINNDMESFIVRSIIPAVVLYGDAVKDQEDYDLGKHIKSSIVKKLKAVDKEGMSVFIEKYLTTYFKLIAYHITQQLWTNYKGVKHLTIECIMRILDLGTENYLIKQRYIRADENSKGLTKGVLKIGNALIELLHPKKSKKEDDSEEKESKPKKQTKIKEESKVKKDEKIKEESKVKKDEKIKEESKVKKDEKIKEEKKTKSKEDPKEKDPKEEKKSTPKKDEKPKEKKPPKKEEKSKKNNKKSKDDEEDEEDDEETVYHSTNEDELEYAN